MDIRKLKFFDKNGKPFNFYFDEQYQVWKGVIIMPKVSVGLYSSAQIFVMEKNSDGDFVYPYDYEKSYMAAAWDTENEYVNEFFLYKFDENRTIYETSALTYTPQDGADTEDVQRGRGSRQVWELDNLNEGSDSESESEQESTYAYQNKPVSIYIGFSATPNHDATTYTRTLKISQITISGMTSLAEIKLYAESDDEDERLKITCQNLGYKILPSDSVIFKETPIEEPFTDYTFLNKKRKEILLEGSNIYPYVGSYKALVNAIKFYGYDNIGIIEYYRNVNRNSVNFGKLYHTNKYSLSDNEFVNVDGKHITLPNKDYKKVNMISLVYDITAPTNTYDEVECPLVEEKFDYTIEEAMIKLYGLRRKLDKDFMPGSSKINDIIGQASYFGVQNVTNSISYNRFDDISAGTHPKFYADNDTPFITYDKFFNKWLKKNKGGGIDTFKEYELAEYFEEYKEFTLDSKSTDFQDTSLAYDDSDSDSDSDSESENDNASAKLILYDNTFGNHYVDEQDMILKYYNNDVTFKNYDTIGFESIEWVINYTGDDNTHQFSKTIYGSIENYRKIFIQLPYIGKYSVTLKIYDNHNNMSITSIPNAIIVKPMEIEIAGFYYDARKLPTSKIEDYTNTIKAEIIEIVEQVKSKILFEREEDSDFNGDTDEGKPNRYYQYWWDNLKTLKYKYADHLTFDVTNHFDTNADGVKPDYTYQFNNIRYIHNGVVIKPYTWFALGINFSKIPNIDTISWELYNEKDDVTPIVKFTGDYFATMIKDEGSYYVKCNIVDTYGNKYTTKKNMFSVKKDADYTSYNTFKKDLEYLQKIKL